MSSQVQNVSVPTCNFLRQKLQTLLVVEKIQGSCKECGTTDLENIWVVVAGKGLQAESFQQNLQNKRVAREETLLQTFLINHVEHFSVPTFSGRFWKPWRKSPSR